MRESSADDGESGFGEASEAAPRSPGILEALGAFLASFALALAVGLFVLASGEPDSGLTYGQVVVQVVFASAMGGLVLLWYHVRGEKGSLRLRGGGWVRSAVVGAAVGLAFQLGVVALFWILETVFPGFDPSKAQGIVEKSVRDSDRGVQLAIVFAAGILAPLSEELYFRGMLLSAVESRSTRYVAVGVSAACFAAIHFNMVAFVPFFLFGTALAVMDIWRDSLVPSVAAHLTFNLVALAALLA